MNEGEVILNVDFFDNFADNYTVLISADGYRNSGFFPVKVSQRNIKELSLMLVPTAASFKFEPWDRACIFAFQDYPIFVPVSPIEKGSR